MMSAATMLAVLTGCSADPTARPGPSSAPGSSGTSAGAAPSGPATLAPPGLDEVSPGFDVPPDGASPVPDDRLDTAALVALLRTRSSTPPAPSQCRTDELAAALRGFDAAAGHRYSSIRVRNTGSRRCAVEGLPGVGVRGVWGSGFVPEVVALDRHFDGTPSAERPVVLEPGEEAVVDLEWTGALRGSEEEAASMILLQTVRGQEPLRVPAAFGGDGPPVDIGQFTTVELSRFYPAS